MSGSSLTIKVGGHARMGGEHNNNQNAYYSSACKRQCLEVLPLCTPVSTPATPESGGHLDCLCEGISPVEVSDRYTQLLDGSHGILNRCD